MRNNPLVLNFPMVGSNVSLMVKEIHEATLDGFVPVLSQCHNMFGSITVTMVKKEGEEIESVSESISTGSTETSNETGGKEDSGSEDDSGNVGHGEDAVDSDINNGSGNDNADTESGVERGGDINDADQKPKPVTRKSTKKAVTPKA